MNINDLTVEQYIAWKREGLRDEEVLERFFYSPSSQKVLRKWKRENGLYRLKIPKRNKLISLTANDFLKYKSSGIENKMIAKELGVSVKTLDKWIRDQKRQGELPNKRIETVKL